MPQRKCWFRMRRILGVFTTALVLLVATLSASTYKVLYKFSGGADGASPNGLVFDKLGNLYGTTRAGGVTGNGTVFKLEPHPNGTWTQTVLHSFRGPDGASPFAGLIFDGAGNLYGTTAQGGPACIYATGGCGVVFKLKPNSDGTWTESVLYRFKGGNSDGATPLAGLVFDGAGNLYSTTSYGGPGGAGDVFQLKRNSNGTWTEKILYMFTGNGPDGYIPVSGLVFDAAGNLYGTTSQGGNMNCPALYGCGVAFRLTPDSDGSWTESLLHIFCSTADCADGSFPEAALVFDKAGNLYSTAAAAGGPPATNGTVFRLKLQSDGSWTEKVLHSFDREAAFPVAGLVFDAAGNLYGTASNGGPADGGAVFKLSPYRAAAGRTLYFTFSWASPRSTRRPA
jgi:uncharacterized repeat protein (TIGR03803 family)